MPRIRTIKPEFWTDVKTGTLSDFAKCLFLGLLNLSDDGGVVQCELEEWRIKLFPYHTLGLDGLRRAISEALGEILDRKLAEVFRLDAGTNADCLYLHIRNFGKHQNINRPSKWSRFAGLENERHASDLRQQIERETHTLTEPSVSAH